MIGRTNAGGGGGTGGTLTVTAPAGVTASVSKDGKIKTKIVGSDGIAVFKGLKAGTWTLKITDGVQTSTKSVKITTDYNEVISFNVIPKFTYTGNFKIVNDSDATITVSQDNWKIRFLTSGTLTFTDLGNADGGIDVFCVGGGGGTQIDRSLPAGGGGGYTKTIRKVAVEVNKGYKITVGAGGTPANNGGSSSAFGNTAAGGYAATLNDTGGNGGSGGGGGESGGSGGSNGADGTPTTGYRTGGKGQISTKGPNGETGNTCEFGESGKKRYAGGGAGFGGTAGDGGGGSPGSNGATNTGGGGGGKQNATSATATSGGSGIVIIRNKR